MVVFGCPFHLPLSSLRSRQAARIASSSIFRPSICPVSIRIFSDLPRLLPSIQKHKPTQTQPSRTAQMRRLNNAETKLQIQRLKPSSKVTSPLSVFSTQDHLHPCVFW